MNTESQNQIIHPASVVGDIQLTATLPHEMVSAQQQLIAWCENKIYVIAIGAKELFEAVEHARKMKWKISALQQQHRKEVKRLTYYEKIKAALENGFYIVPNFPIQMFAIRTKKKNVSGASNSYWGEFEQSSQELSLGEGEYKNPFPLTARRNSQHDSQGKEVVKAKSWADDWDEFEFPITMAKPLIMKATSRAMALKIFDRIGIMPATRKEDPVIIGQTFMKAGYSEKIVSFMVAWHLNTNVL